MSIRVDRSRVHQHRRLPRLVAVMLAALSVATVVLAATPDVVRAAEPAATPAGTGPVDLGNDKRPLPAPTGPRGSPWGAVAAPGRPAVSGAGFNTIGGAVGNNAGYTIRLVSSGAGDVEQLRGYANNAAAQLSSITGGAYTVAGGQVGGFSPPVGQIWIRLEWSDACTGTWDGCGGPSNMSYLQDGLYAFAGTVTIKPSALGYGGAVAQQIVSHEIGHAIGLDHYNDSYAGSYQVMRTPATGVTGFQAGDQNGIRYLHAKGNPIGYLDSVSSPGPGQLRARGWTLDPNTTSSIPVHIYVTPTQGHAFTAGRSRTDVGSAYPGYGNLHGYDEVITVAGGTYNVCAYGINASSTPGANVGLSGNCKSVTVGAATAPGTPTSVTATPGNASANVTWGAAPANGSAVTGYVVTASPGGLTTAVAGTTTAATLTGLTNGTSYTFTVRASNAVGAGPASAPSNAVTPAAPPGPPRSVVATAGDQSATVTWFAPTSDGGAAITAYRVIASPGGAQASVSGATFAATFSGLSNGTPYTFVVHARNSSGEGPASPASGAVTPQPPRPANDDFAAAVVVPGAGGSLAGTNVGATRQTGEPEHVHDVAGGVTSVWFRWTAPSAGTLTIDTVGSDYDTLLAVYTGTAVGSLAEVVSNDDIGGGVTQSRVTVAVQRGVVYRIAIDGYQGQAGTIAGTVGFVAAPGRFTALAPNRILDSRTGLGTPAGVGPMTGGDQWSVKVTGVGGVPAGVEAVVLNATVTQGSVDSHLTVWEAGQPMPGSSNLNWPAGRTVANMVVVPVSSSGYVQVFNSTGTVHVIFDVVGYVGSAGSLLTAQSPARIVDSRSGLGVVAGPWTASATRDVQVTGVGGVPSTGVTAVLANITVTDATGASHLTVWPAGSVRPTASSLNWVAGQTVANLVVVKVGVGGKVSVFNNAGQVDVIVDVVGYYSSSALGQLLVPVPPERIADSRYGTGGVLGRWSAATTRDVGVVGVGGVPSAGVSAVVLNVTVTNATGASHLTVWPAGSARPTASSLNWAAGQTVANLVVVKVGEGGKVSVFNNAGQVDVIVDVVGWFG